MLLTTTAAKLWNEDAIFVLQKFDLTHIHCLLKFIFVKLLLMLQRLAYDMQTVVL